MDNFEINVKRLIKTKCGITLYLFIIGPFLSQKKKKTGPSKIALTFKGGIHIDNLIFLYFETKRAGRSIVDFIDGTQIYIDTISTQTPNPHDC